MTVKPRPGADAHDASQKEPRVSLVVLNWNGREHSAQCLQSLVELEYPGDRLEIILWDNGSIDGSAVFLRSRFPSVRIISSETNLGFAEGNNRAAAEARHEWVAFINNDVRVPPDWLRHLASRLRAHPEARCIASRIMNWDGTAIDFVGGSMNFYGHGFQPGFGESRSIIDVERRVLFACGGALLIRRDLFLEVGGFDPSYFLFFEDIDLGWRLNLLGHDVWYTPEATVFHRHHGSVGKLRSHVTEVLYDRNALYSIFKCFETETLNEVLPAALLLLNERGLLMADVDRHRFRVGGQPEAEPRPAAIRRSLQLRAFDLYKSAGVAAAYRRTFELLRARAAQALIPPDHAVIPLLALGPGVGMSQFATDLVSLKAKRQWIQERRVRSDEEIIPLFVEPFRAESLDPRYLEFMDRLCRVLELDRRFTSEITTARRSPHSQLPETGPTDSEV